MTENTPERNDFVFLPKGMDNVVMPLSKVEGPLAEDVYPIYLRLREERFGSNLHFRLRLQDGELVGSTLQDIALIDEVVREYGGRVLLPSDLHNDMTVPDMIKDKHYVDRFGLILRGPEATLYDERGRNIAETLEARDEIDVSRLQEEPALVTDLKVVPAEDGYGFVFQPRGEELSVVYSDKFNQRYNEKRFNNFDEKGVPTDFADEGVFRNYTGSEPPRVSRFGLYRGWNSDSAWAGFDDSGTLGRVVVTADEVSQIAPRKSELLSKIGEIRK